MVIPSSAGSSAKRTVIVVVEEDESLTKSYRMPQNTKLSEIMQIWKGDFDLIGHWRFVSDDEEINLNTKWMTLEMVGEKQSRVVTLIAELPTEPTSSSYNETFVYRNDKCHRFFSKPHEKLYQMMWQLPEIPNRIEYNGVPLNPKQSLIEAGLQDKAVIYEPLSHRSITIKLSTGAAITVQLPSNCLVLHLMEKVRVYEIDEFSLKYEGRYLRSEENIKRLTHVVEVTTAQFVVHFNDRRVSWTTKGEQISFSEFVSQLSVKGDIETRKLAAMEFTCIGCQRRIWDSKQQMSVNCCGTRSLSLKAMVSPGNETKSVFNEMVWNIQNFYNDLKHSKIKDSGMEDSHRERKTIEEGFVPENLNYSMITQCIEKLHRSNIKLEDRIKVLKASVESFNTLKTKNSELVENLERIKCTNVKYFEEIKMLKAENKNSNNECAKLKNENAKLKSDNENDDRRRDVGKREQQIEKQEYQVEKRERQVEKREYNVERREYNVERRENNAEIREHKLEGRERQVEVRENDVQSKEDHVTMLEVEFERRDQQLERREEALEKRELQLDGRE